MAEQSLLDSPFKCPWCLHLDTDHDPLPVGCTQCDCRHSATEPDRPASAYVRWLDNRRPDDD